MTPLMNSSAPGVVNSMSRYAWRLPSVDSRPIESKRFLIVPLLSSAARMPLPSATRAVAIACRSVLAMGDSWIRRCGRRFFVFWVCVFGVLGLFGLVGEGVFVVLF